MRLTLAKDQLKRVQAAWDPPDWSVLAMFSFLCLENAVTAAALHAGINFQTTRHSSKAQAAKELATRHGLLDVSSLLIKLNDARKSTSYGDAPWPNLDAKDVVTEVESFVNAVEAFIAK